MPGFSNVRYRFYSDIDRLTAVLALHERKIAHPFDKCLLTQIRIRIKEANRRRSLKCKARVTTSSMLFPFLRTSLILQPLYRFTNVIAHSPTLPPLYLRHSSFYNPFAASTTSQTLRLRHSSFSNPSAASSTYSSFYNPSVASPTSQLILQPFRRLTYVTGHFRNLPLLHLRHRHFTYVTWGAANAQGDEKTCCGGLACYSNLLSLEVATVLDSC